MELALGAAQAQPLETVIALARNISLYVEILSCAKRGRKRRISSIASAETILTPYYFCDRTGMLILVAVLFVNLFRETICKRR